MDKHEPTPEYGDVKPLYINGVYVGDDNRADVAERPMPTLADQVRQAFSNQRQIDVCLELVRVVNHYAELCQHLHARINTLEDRLSPSPTADDYVIEVGDVVQPVVAEGNAVPQAEPITLTGDEPAPPEADPVIPAP
jgi:hypothetical protein